MKTKLNSEHADDTEKKWNPRKGLMQKKIEIVCSFFLLHSNNFSFFLLSIVDVFKKRMIASDDKV